MGIVVSYRQVEKRKPGAKFGSKSTRKITEE